MRRVLMGLMAAAILMVLLFPAFAAERPIPLIYDTDMGNDIDDALALAMIHALESRGECRLIAVTVTKDNRWAAPFIDLVNTFYGRGEIPIGVVRRGKTPEDGDYIRQTVELKGADGSPRYRHDLKDGGEAPDAVSLLRKLLSAYSDGSVVIAQVGFSTNLARLLDSPGDKHSPLSGRELANEKVRLLSVMAGDFAKGRAEYNVKIDQPAAAKLFDEWPTEIVVSGFEIGESILYPASSIEQDFNYVEHHPVAEAYGHYREMPYDRETWDLTAVLHAVRPDHHYFHLSEKGRVRIDDKSVSHFEPAARGRHRRLISPPESRDRVLEALIQLASQPPQTLTAR